MLNELYQRYLANLAKQGDDVNNIVFRKKAEDYRIGDLILIIGGELYGEAVGFFVDFTEEGEVRYSQKIPFSEGTTRRCTFDRVIDISKNRHLIYFAASQGVLERVTRQEVETTFIG